MTKNLLSLLDADAVRARCAVIGEAAEQGSAHWFEFDRSALSDCVDTVAAECLRNYPNLDIPYHSRWRHFVVNDVDLWKVYSDKHLSGQSPAATARTAIDLVFVSVLLDAGAGNQWQYTDSISGQVLSRSEGLAAASLNLFFSDLGNLNSSGEYGISADTLHQCTEKSLATVFQHSADNPLIGIPGRVKLLSGLADALEKPGAEQLHRPGNLYDRICLQFPTGRLPAGELLKMVLHYFNSMWPDGMVQDGVYLGDCGRHSLLDASDGCQKIVPFHKLSQWLTYSLLEPLQWAGIKVTHLDQLTGLPEYRNGGLFIDTGVLKLKDITLLKNTLSVTSETIVEWRALTVWLLDQVAEGVRERLNLDAQRLPLASILQGGTWSAGRRLALEIRGGLPPLNLDIQGTVF